MGVHLHGAKARAFRWASRYIEADPGSSSGKWENSSESLPISPLDLEEDGDEEQKVLVNVDLYYPGSGGFPIELDGDTDFSIGRRGHPHDHPVAVTWQGGLASAHDTLLPGKGGTWGFGHATGMNLYSLFKLQLGGHSDAYGQILPHGARAVDEVTY